MAPRITTLSENTAGARDFLAEWGLSFLIETGTETILFDTSKTITAAHNADSLGADLKQVSKIVLSHGHYDHTGGLRQVLRRMHKEVTVIAHPDVWASKYSRRKGKKDRYAGLPFQREDLESLGAVFSLAAESVKVAENCFTTGEVPMVTDYETIDSSLFVRTAAGWQPDPLLDDLSLIIKTELGLVVVLGCAHRGIINTLYHAQQLTGVKPIRMVLGGCHLISATQERLWQTIAALKELGVARIGVSHCTGLPAAATMAGEFGDSFFFNNAGTRINLP